MAGTIRVTHTKGEKIGELTFIEECEKINNRRGALFQCQCGTLFKTQITSAKSLNATSCGCRFKKTMTVHGQTIDDKVQSVEYETWLGAKRRCKGYNLKTRRVYTDKGITVCDRWLEPKGQGFLNFLEDMGPRPEGNYSLDRKDGTKGYNPENCRWATDKEQANNKCNNRNIEYLGKVQTLKLWAEELNINANTLHNRLNKQKLSIEEAFTKPVKSINKKVEQ